MNTITIWFSVWGAYLLLVRQGRAFIPERALIFFFEKQLNVETKHKCGLNVCCWVLWWPCNIVCFLEWGFLLDEYGHLLIKTHLKEMLIGRRGLNGIIIKIVWNCARLKSRLYVLNRSLRLKTEQTRESWRGTSPSPSAQKRIGSF